MEGLKPKLIPVAIVALFLLVAAYSAGAVQFSANMNQTNYTYLLTTNEMIAGANTSVMITVINSNSTNNISSVNITLPTGFTFVTGSNSTSITPGEMYAFSNTGQNLTWINMSNVSLVNASNGAGGHVQNFSFNVTAPITPGNYSFIVFTGSNETAVNNYTYVNFTVVGATSSRNGFAVSSNNTFFNWSPFNLSIVPILNASSTINLSIKNSTTTINPTNFPSSAWSSGEYTNLGSTNYIYCLSNGMRFDARDTNDTRVNETGALNTSNGSFTYVQLQALSACPPGTYKGFFDIYNTTNTTDNTSIFSTVNIPINVNNTFISSNYTAIFKGNNSANTTDYQSFFFFTNISSNMSFVTINLTSLSSDVDMYLFNRTNGVNKFIMASDYRGNTTESIHRKLETNELWEIRIYGNTTNSTFGNSSYTGFLYFSTLNTSVNGTTNTTLDYNVLHPGDSLNASVTLNNTGSGQLSAANQSIELHQDISFAPQNSSSSNYFIVPEYTSKMRVEVSWDQNSSSPGFWGAYLHDPSGRLINYSLNKTTNMSVANTTAHQANFANATITEWIEFPGHFNKSNEGLWRLNVSNLTFNSSGTNSSDLTLPNYVVNVTLWTNTSSWVSYSWNNLTETFDPTQTFSFNQTNGTGNYENSSLNVTYNLTVPASSSISGNYSGTIYWQNGSGWQSSIPIKFKLDAGTLVVNGTISNTTITMYDNIGFNKTRNISVQYNNTGNQTIGAFLTNPGQLNLTSSPSIHINLTTDTSVYSPLYGNKTNGTLNLTYIVGTNVTGNSNPGLYKGYVYFNATNSTNATNNSYPYGYFNLSLIMNLSSNLYGNITIVNHTAIGGNIGTAPWMNRTMPTTNSSEAGADVNASLNFTAKVFFANGTAAFSSESALGTNGGLYFPAARINSSNVTGFSYDVNVTKAGSGNLCDPTDGCNLSVIVPPNIPGGNYTVSVDTVWNGTGGYINLSGTLSNNSFMVNGTGINITNVTADSSIDLIDANSTSYNVSVTNFGPQTATGILSFGFENYSDPVYANIHPNNATFTHCYTSFSNSSGANFTLNLTPGKTCWYEWTIVGTNVSTNWSESNLMIRYAKPSGNFSNSDGIPYNNITGIALSVTNFVFSEGSSSSSSSSGSSSGSSGGSSGASCSADSDCASGYYCSSSTCTALSCTSEQYAGEHACVDYNYTLRITPTDEVVYVTLGEKNTTKAKFKNIGNIAFEAKFAGDAGIGVTTTPSTEKKSLGINVETTITFTFETNPATPIGNHTITLKGFKSDNEAKLSTRDIILTVLVTEEKKALIAGNQTNLSAFLTTLESTYNAVKGGLTAEKQTEIEAMISAMKTKVAEASTALTGEDYYQADALHREIISTITDYYTKLSAAQEESAAAATEFWGGATMWIIVGIVAIVIAGFVIYMLLPPKKGQKFKAVKTKQKGKGFGGLFKKSSGRQAPWSSGRPRPLYKPAKPTPKQYQKGYQRASTPNVSGKKGPGMGQKIKSIFKRKKKQQGLYKYAGK